MSVANEAYASNAELDRIYRDANGIADGKRAPLTTEAVFKAMRAVVAAEREACAQLVDVKQGVEAWEIHGGQETIDVLRGLAAAIRSR